MSAGRSSWWNEVRSSIAIEEGRAQEQDYGTPGGGGRARTRRARAASLRQHRRAAETAKWPRARSAAGDILIMMMSLMK